jgi:hypothetical protein
MKLTGAAILVSRGMKALQAAPAAYPYRSAKWRAHEERERHLRGIRRLLAATLDGDGEIVHPERLDRSKLDYSLPSLKVVDDYLTYLHEHRTEQMGRDWVKVVLWGGAYVAEVIRSNAPREYNWVDFDEFTREYPDSTRSANGLLNKERYDSSSICSCCRDRHPRRYMFPCRTRGRRRSRLRYAAQAPDRVRD